MQRAFGTNLTNPVVQHQTVQTVHHHHQIIKPTPVFACYGLVPCPTLKTEPESSQKRKSLQLKNRPNILRRKRLNSLNTTPAEVSVNVTPIQETKIKKEPLDTRNQTNPHKKPPYSYMAMIQFAIESAGESRRMTLKGIYDYIENKFPYFRQAKPGWKNSVRHNLSLHPIFYREPNPTNSKVSFWCMRKDGQNRGKSLDDYDENGRRPNKRPRKEAHPKMKASDYNKENIPPLGYQSASMRLAEDENPEIILHPVESPIKTEPIEHQGVAQDSFDAIVDRFIATDGRGDVSVGHDSFTKFIDELGSPFTTLHSARQSEKKKRPVGFDPRSCSTPALARTRDGNKLRPKVRRAIANELDAAGDRKQNDKANLSGFDDLEDLFEILD